MLGRLVGYALEPILLGASGADVWRCTMPHAPTRVLKSAPIAAGLRLDREVERLRWMRDHGAPVPAVCDYERVGSKEYLLLDEVPGTAASDPQWIPLAPEVAAALGQALAALHRTSTADCPFDERIAVRIEEARRRANANLVDEADFDDARAGRTAEELLAELLATTAPDEDAVFTHGDFSLPNIILQQPPYGGVRVAGLIDCGRSGVADRYQDLALKVRDIAGTFGEAYVAPFLRAYGSIELRDDKLAYYTLLDEFF
jgi:aminoglycoside 3'-phosphotransferase-2